MFQQASRNANDGINLLQTAEGAMASMDEILIRMKELAEQASNDTYSVKQRDIMDQEFTQLSEEITRIANSTKYNEKQLLNAGGTTIAIHLGDGTIDVTSADMTATGLSLDSNAAVTEVWKHSIYKSSADDLYLAGSDIVAGVTDHIEFWFDVDGLVGDANVAVDLDALGYATSGISLNNLVTEINTEAGYAAATAVYDADYGAYRLHLSAQTAGDSAMAWGSVVGNSCVLFDADADWVGSAPMTDGSAAGGSVSLASATAAQAALGAVSTAIEDKDTYRAELGPQMALRLLQ
jgi:flagellin